MKEFMEKYEKLRKETVAVFDEVIALVEGPKAVLDEDAVFASIVSDSLASAEFVMNAEAQFELRDVHSFLPFKFEQLRGDETVGMVIDMLTSALYVQVHGEEHVFLGMDTQAITNPVGGVPYSSEFADIALNQIAPTIIRNLVAVNRREEVSHFSAIIRQ